MIIAAIGLFHLDCFHKKKRSDPVTEKYLWLAGKVTVSRAYGRASPLLPVATKI